MLTDEQAQECEGILTTMKIIKNCLDQHEGAEWLHLMITKQYNRLEEELQSFELEKQPFQCVHQYPTLFLWMETLKETADNGPQRKRMRLERDLSYYKSHITWLSSQVEKHKNEISTLQTYISKNEETRKDIEGKLLAMQEEEI